MRGIKLQKASASIQSGRMRTIRPGSAAKSGGTALSGVTMEPRKAARLALSGRAVRRSLLVALLVGTALNVINQGPEILSGRWPVIWKLALTYVVPFLVASYGSYAAFRSSR